MEMDKEMYIAAGERIQSIRIIKGVRREHLAEAAKISSKFLYEIENGRKGFSAQVLYNISKVLKVDCDYILTGDAKMGYDKSLIEALKLFDKDQMGRVSVILKKIYELL